MHTELVDHAARILQHVPTRCMRADALHERAVRETGHAMPYPRFLEVLAARARFAVLDCPVDVSAQEGWSAGERTAYAEALARAGCPAAPIVTLAPVEATSPAGPAPPPVGPRRRRNRPVPPPVPACPRDELLGAVHAGLAALLGGADPALREALAAATVELESIRRVLGAGSEAVS